MLTDPVRAVRIEAARALADIPVGEFPSEQKAVLEAAVQEYIEAQQAMAERAAAQTNLGSLYAARGDFDHAVAAYETATEVNARYVPAYVNLADLYRAQGRETDAEKILRRGIKVTPENASLHHALGLSLVRQQHTSDALKELRLAYTLQSENVRYIYVYAVALHSTGKPEQAIMVLQGAHNAHPNNGDILNALVAFYRDAGNTAAARTYAEKLRSISP
jgi:tetratricopeptide (TPR) repeat protein